MGSSGEKGSYHMSKGLKKLTIPSVNLQVLLFRFAPSTKPLNLKANSEQIERCRWWDIYEHFRQMRYIDRNNKDLDTYLNTMLEAAKCLAPVTKSTPSVPVDRFENWKNEMVIWEMQTVVVEERKTNGNWKGKRRSHRFWRRGGMKGSC